MSVPPKNTFRAFKAEEKRRAEAKKLNREQAQLVDGQDMAELTLDEERQRQQQLEDRTMAQKSKEETRQRQLDFEKLVHSDSIIDGIVSYAKNQPDPRAFYTNMVDEAHTAPQWTFLNLILNELSANWFETWTKAASLVSERLDPEYVAPNPGATNSQPIITPATVSELADVGVHASKSLIGVGRTEKRKREVASDDEEMLAPVPKRVMKPRNQKKIPILVAEFGQKLQESFDKGVAVGADLVCTKCGWQTRQPSVTNCLHLYCTKCIELMKTVVKKNSNHDQTLPLCANSKCNKTITKTSKVTNEVMKSWGKFYTRSFTYHNEFEDLDVEDDLPEKNFRGLRKTKVGRADKQKIKVERADEQKVKEEQDSDDGIVRERRRKCRTWAKRA